ncbi:MAG: outer membrane beta-barrel protein [Betaproteobacteria bacterium]
MPTRDASLKTLALSAVLVAGSAISAHGDDPSLASWYGGQSTGFWGLSNSVGVRGDLPGAFAPPGRNADTLNAQRLYGGYRISDAFAIEGSQTQFGATAGGCNGESRGRGDAYQSCGSSAWSLAGIATVPVTTGLSLYGKLGLHYWQRGFQDDAAHRNADDPGNLGKVYGIGLSYDLSKSVSFHAESERYSELAGNNSMGPNASIGLDSSVHSIGLSIKF